MLETLIPLTQTGEFEDNGGIRFHSALQSPDELVLEVYLVPGDGSDDQHWLIECSNVRDYRLNGEFSQGLSVVSTHPVLLPFTEDVADLYFNRPAPNPSAAVGDLWECHRRLVGS
jgi:hypothetical protein